MKSLNRTILIRLRAAKAASPFAFLLLSSTAFAGERPAQLGEKFIVHEWGTFTSYQGSNGRTQHGMYREEEALPGFVQGRCKLTGSGGDVHGSPKCSDFMPKSGSPLGVDQKMETPVIYFYSDAKKQASVTVDFPSGIISQWFPEATAFSPAIDHVDRVAGGKMTWDVTVNDYGSDLALPTPMAASIWLPSRQVNANTISFKDQNEKFVFYRGLGQFTVPFYVTSNIDNKVTIQNKSDEPIANVFLMEFDGNRGYFLPLKGVGSNHSIDIAKPSIALNGHDKLEYLAEAKSALTQALAQSGLYDDEALAMTNTWESHYFLTPGVRVLYVWPRAWADKVLPLSIAPAPDQIVRTMVGRVEITTAQQEQALIGDLQTAAAAATRFDYDKKIGRLAEPILRGLLSSNLGEPVKVKIEEYLRRQ